MQASGRWEGKGKPRSRYGRGKIQKLQGQPRAKGTMLVRTKIDRDREIEAAGLLQELSEIHEINVALPVTAYRSYGRWQRRIRSQATQYLRQRLSVEIETWEKEGNATTSPLVLE